MRARRAFTLIEMLMVVVILGLLASISIQPIWNMRDKARVATVKVELKRQLTQAEAYFYDNGTYLGYVPRAQSRFIGLNLDFIATDGIRIRGWDSRVGRGMCWIAVGSAVGRFGFEGAVDGLMCRDNDMIWQ